MDDQRIQRRPTRLVLLVKVRKVVVKVLTEQRPYERQGSADYDSAERQRKETAQSDRTE